MDTITFRTHSFFKGVWDSIAVWRTLSTSRTLRGIAIRLLPLYLITVAVGVCFHVLDWMIGVNSVWWHHTLLWAFWSIFWNVPIYTLGSLLQLRYAWQIRKRIADASGVTSATTTKKRLTNIISESVYGVLLNLTYLTQTLALDWGIWLVLPSVVGDPIRLGVSIITISWATAFSAFECRLITEGEDLFRRVYFVETHWSYALGYGAVTSIVYHVVPHAVASGLWQYSLLILMLNAMCLQLPTFGRGPSGGIRSTPASRLVDNKHRLRVFWFAQRFAVGVIGVLLHWYERLSSLALNSEKSNPDDDSES